MTPPLSITQVVASVEDEAAGPSYSVPRLSSALAQCGAKVALHSLVGAGSSSGGGPTDRSDLVERHVHPCSTVPGFNMIRASGSLRRGLQAAAPTTNIFHTHGLWLMPNVYPAWSAQQSGAPFLLSPRGMLGPAALAFSRLKKAVFWRLFQKDAVSSAACLHATSELEFDDIRAFGLTNPVAIVPNGIDLPTLPARLPAGGPRTVLSLGRIHPKKGLERLVRAWGRLETDGSVWRLRIVGADELGHAAELRALAAREGLSNVTVEGPLFGQDKLDAYCDADLFVLPTLSDNFAMTVAEALAAGTPVISTKGAPWAGLDSHGCGWWVEHGEDALAAVLATAMAMPRSELKAMGAKGRDWMAMDFSWEAMGRDMLEVYNWLARGGERPAHVREGQTQ
jgi:glycosyltransferase involved in cell wall biosynthesis